MNTGTLVISTILVLIGVAPFILMAMGKRKKRKQLLQLVQQIPEAQGCSLVNIEYCGDIMLCMDTEKRYLFFTKITKDEKTSSKCVDLSKVVRCEFFKQSRSVKGNGASYTVIDRLELHFFASKNASEFIKLTFFNADKGFQPTTELEVMDRWTEMINAQVGGPAAKVKQQAVSVA